MLDGRSAASRGAQRTGVEQLDTHQSPTGTQSLHLPRANIPTNPRHPRAVLKRLLKATAEERAREKIRNQGLSYSLRNKQLTEPLRQPWVSARSMVGDSCRQGRKPGERSRCPPSAASSIPMQTPPRPTLASHRVSKNKAQARHRQRVLQETLQEASLQSRDTFRSCRT